MIRARPLNSSNIADELRLAASTRGPSERQRSRVQEILTSIRSDGDRAVRQWSSKLDGWSGAIEATPEVRELSRREVPSDLLLALEFAAGRIRSFHEAQRPTSVRHTLPGGSTLELVFQPLRRAGVYVPGGRAPYPSTVLMTALCARAAGVAEVVLATPPRPGSPGGLDPAVAAAASLAEVDSIYLVGGATAIGALAYGTESIPRVDKIAGPGNSYVTAAKREVFGDVGIDSLSGPSESLLVVDEGARPDWVVREAMAQIEHGPDSRVLVVALGPSTAERLASDLGERLSSADGASSANSTPVSVLDAADTAVAWELADALAPESLYIDTVDLDRWRRDPPRCGALFLGPWSSVTFGDYVSGSNHVLPVRGAARFSSGLTVFDFGRWVAVQELTEADAAELSPPGARIAEAEGMRWHAEAQKARGKAISPGGGGKNG